MMIRVMVDILKVKNIRDIKSSRLISTHLDSLVPSFDTVSGVVGFTIPLQLYVTVNNLNLELIKQTITSICQITEQRIYRLDGLIA